MTHRAESIIAAVVGKVTGLTTTAARVYRGRQYPLEAAALPGLCVYLGPDEPLGQSSQDLIDSLLTVYVEAVAKSASAQIDTLLNTMRAEITVALQADFTQGLAYVIDTIEGAADEPDISNDGEQPAARLRTHWQFHYRRRRTDPSSG